jgi:signal transduction histidine kinase
VKTPRRDWLIVGLLATLAAVAGALQYRWIGEVSQAERVSMRAGLESSLKRLAEEFNLELNSGLAALMPSEPVDETAREAAYAARARQWRETAEHPELFRRIAIALPDGDGLTLRHLDPASGAFADGEWPPHWGRVREMLHARMRRFMPRPLPMNLEESSVIDVPRFRSPPGRGRGRPEIDWLLVELNLEYIRNELIPELLRRHLGERGPQDYHAQLMPRDRDGSAAEADATVTLLDVQYDQIARRGGGFRRGGPSPGPERGRWLLAVRHRAGSLEAVVSRTRLRNLAVSAVILAVMLAAMAALVRFSRRAERLARMQMEFVAGVSHELRTPLSVIRTAAHNLHGGLVANAAQIERYGALIAEEADRLGAIIEQVLRFAGAQAGRAVAAREAVVVEKLIDDALAAIAGVLDESRSQIEKRVAPNLPPVFADPAALRHALQNLLINAAKYGRAGGWIGVAAAVAKDDPAAVEIRVADRGPGIPPEDLGQIFDPFYRGRKAVEEQIHGTGLGLNLVKRIAEAHQGSVTVRSQPGEGAEFVLRIPAVPAEKTDELAHPVSRG